MIRVEGFSKTYGKRPAVSGLTFEVRPGDILGLVGPNGAGKTTTLRAVAGIIAPTEGRLLVAGHDIVREPVQAKRRLGVIADSPQLFGNLTVWEHIEFTARLYDVPDHRSEAERLLADFEMLDYRDRAADELSLGMKQKVVVVCTLLHEPEVLLLDEPLSGLDPKAIRTLYDALRRRAALGSAIIISSHLLGQIERLCNRFLILRDGRQLFLGALEEIRAQLPSLRADASLEDLFLEATESFGRSDGGTEAP